MWCPYRAAEQYHDLEVVQEELPPASGGGLYIRYGDGSALIALDPRLHGPERRAALTHEVVHHERGGGAHGRDLHWTRPDRAREEARVRRITAERLVPMLDLQRFVDCQADLGLAVGPDEVMREFDVTWQVACDALENLARWERRSTP